MGRELRRKEAKRDGRNVKEVQKANKNNSITSKNLIRIIIALIVLFVLTYLLTGVFATKDIKWFSKKDKNSDEEEISIQNKILGIDSLKQKDREYYVYFYNPDKEDESVTSIVNTLAATIYRVDLSDAFNANFIGTPSGIVSDINDLKVENEAVIKVADGIITEFYGNKEEIKSLED